MKPSVRTDPPSVLLVASSLRQRSHTRALVTAIAKRLIQEGGEAKVWDLHLQPLPIADPNYHHKPEDHPNPDVRAFVCAAANADAIVLATPIYHNGPAGVLKNALDHLVIRHLYLKPVGLVSHGGARTTQAVEQLRINIRGMLGYAIVTQVCTADEDYGSEGQTGEFVLTSQPIIERVNRFCRELMVMAKVMPYARQIFA